MPLLDIKGEEVFIGDKVLCAIEKKHLALGVFEKVSKVSFIIRIGGSWAFSIHKYEWVENPLWNNDDRLSAYALGKTYLLPRVIQIDNDKPNRSIIKVDKDFSL